MKAKPIRVGTAAWAIAKSNQTHFPKTGTLLEKYSACLNAVEINTSFYREHKPETYARWASSVPSNFRFCVKIAKTFTHELSVSNELTLAESVSNIMHLGSNLGCLLVQLPPKLKFNLRDSNKFFSKLRQKYDGAIAFEPRHVSWDEPKARISAKEFRLSRVLADPQPYFLRKFEDTDFHQLVYYRLHGSPVIYRSSYEPERIDAYADQIESYAKKKFEVWCVFDNTTFGHATTNALELRSRLKKHSDLIG